MSLISPDVMNISNFSFLLLRSLISHHAKNNSICLVSFQSLREMLSSSRVNIGLKMMGEVDEKAFKNACNLRFPPEEAEIKALELCSLWQEKLKNPQWYPVKVTTDDKGNPQVGC